MFGFERLEVWQKAIDFAEGVYRATDQFPSDERFGLISQLRRSSVSVSSNIAEGSGRSSRRDFARFVEISYGSLLEVVSQLHIARRKGFLTGVAFQELYRQAEHVARLSSGLRSRLLNDRQP